MIQPQEITNNPRQDVDDEVRAQMMDFAREMDYLTTTVCSGPHYTLDT